MVAIHPRRAPPDVRRRRARPAERRPGARRRPQLRSSSQGGLADEARPVPRSTGVAAWPPHPWPSHCGGCGRRGDGGSVGRWPAAPGATPHRSAAASSAGAPLVEPSPPSRRAPPVVVGPGDTLWGIARQITPAGGDVAATVDRLVARNGGVTWLVPGMRLELD